MHTHAHTHTYTHTHTHTQVIRTELVGVHCVQNIEIKLTEMYKLIHKLMCSEFIRLAVTWVIHTCVCVCVYVCVCVMCGVCM